MIVPDASAVALRFVNASIDERGREARAVLARDPGWAVPEHWRVEVFSAIRGLWLDSTFDDERAVRAIAVLRDLVVEVIPTHLLLPRMWDLRSSLSAYDAGYVAAAETRGCTLVTADARITRTDAPRCPMRLIS